MITSSILPHPTNEEEFLAQREYRIKTFWNCGVYRIVNLVNEHSYIGSSTNIKQRFAQHKANLRHNRHHNQHLQNAWNKYGENNFEFQIIENWAYPERILNRENKNIRIYKPEYNNIKVNKESLFFHSEETKRKIGIKSKEKFIKNPNLREDFINRVTGRAPWNKGLKTSSESIKKMSNTRKLRINSGKILPKSKKVINIDTNEIYSSVKEVSEKYNISCASLGNQLRGTSNNTTSFKFYKEYLNENT